ncbi:MAG: DUF3592 domain-containing protein [Oscillospiraceae bacterium]|nr:DUF3592 domain-containing protein [Oscillospiraceae bacterium]
MKAEAGPAGPTRNPGLAFVFVIIGAVLIIAGVVMTVLRPAGKLSETVGTVTSVTEAAAAGGRTECDIGFSYTVDGTEYRSGYSHLAGTYSVGDAVRVRYDSSDPSRVASAGNGGFIAPAMIILGIFAAAYGLFRSAGVLGKRGRDASG